MKFPNWLFASPPGTMHQCVEDGFAHEEYRLLHAYPSIHLDNYNWIRENVSLDVMFHNKTRMASYLVSYLVNEANEYIKWPFMCVFWRQHPARHSLCSAKSIKIQLATSFPCVACKL